MVICLAVGCESDIRQGKNECLSVPKERISETTMPIKTRRRNIQSIQQARMNHAYCVSLNPGWKKMGFQVGPK